MPNKRTEIALKLVKITNIVLMSACFAVAWMGYYASRTSDPYYAKGNYLIIALFVLLYVICEQIYDALLISMVRISGLIFSQSLSALVADVIMYIVCWLLTKHLPTVWPLLLVFFAQIMVAGIWSYLAHKWYFHFFNAKKSAVIYGYRRGMEQLIKEYELDVKYDVVRNLHISDCLLKGFKQLDGIEVVFLSGVQSHDRNIVLKYCVSKGIVVYVIPRIGDLIMSGAKQMHMFHLPILQVRRYQPGIEFAIVKRLGDILVSAAMLLLLSPVMIITAIAIRMTDHGPVFYKQCRLTKDGKRFNVIKFRSMRIDAEKDGVARLSTGAKDDRITNVGKFIRKTRIDELPQLLNILAGDMSIVGPRPERPEIAAQYEKELPEFALRLQAKAGLTGYAQVYGKYNTTPYDKLQMDLMYIAKPSLIADLHIIFATVKIIFVPESTEGVAEGQTTAGQYVKEAGAERRAVTYLAKLGEKGELHG